MAVPSSSETEKEDITVTFARMPDEDERRILLERYAEQQSIKRQEMFMKREQERISKRPCQRCGGDGREPHTRSNPSDPRSGVSCRRCKGSGWDPR